MVFVVVMVVSTTSDDGDDDDDDDGDARDLGDGVKGSREDGEQSAVWCMSC